MYKTEPKFGNLNRGQMREIYHNKSGLTERQLAARYGVPVKVIRGVRISVGRNLVVWRAARSA